MKKTKPKPKTKLTPKPNYLPFEIDERIISNQIQTIFKLMKELFLEVKERSRELESEKNQTQNPNQYQANTQIKAPTFKIDKKTIPKQIKPILLKSKDHS